MTQSGKLQTKLSRYYLANETIGWRISGLFLQPLKVTKICANAMNSKVNAPA